MRYETREQLQALLQKILEPLKPHYSRAGLHIGDTAACYGTDTARMEAFLRPLWGLVPCWAGGSETGFEEIYAKGLAAGTDPKHEEYWGGFWDGDQRFVEMASIACGLLAAPEKLWNPLSEQERENLVRWLSAINSYRLPMSNWICFRILVNVALKKRGCAYDPQKLAEALEIMESWYLGDGWYKDGDSDQRDYYVSFALHYYGLVYSRYMADEDAERCDRFRSRAVEFAHQFIYWFDEDGAALPYGRSLTYRFAQAAFFSACAAADVWPYPMGVMKGIIVRHLEYWMQQPIFDRAGLLTIGYAYPNLCMAETYNAPGSPYWALKTFAVLALPESHPFWKAEIQPLPSLESQKLLPHARMLVRRYPGHTTAYVSGAFSSNNLGHFPEKYGKFAYDTKFAFSVSKSNVRIEEFAPDSTLAFAVDGYLYTRRGCTSFQMSETEMVSEWSPCRGITVVSRIIPTPQGHLREHTVESEFACIAYDCGFAVPTEKPEDCCGRTELAAFSQNDTARCEAVLQQGPGEPVVLGADANTNLACNKTRIPAVRYCIPAGRTILRTEILASYTD